MKKSKLLLVLVVALLVCSMLFTLIACKPKEEPKEEDKEEETTPVDTNALARNKVVAGITKALAAEGKAGMKYAISVPVADTEVDGAMKKTTIEIELSALIDPVKKDDYKLNPSRIKIGVNKKVDGNSNLKFNLFVGADSVYIEAKADDGKTIVRELPGFFFGEAINGADISKGKTVVGFLPVAINMLFPTAVESGDTVTLTGDLSIVGTMIGGFVAGLPDMDESGVANNFAGTIGGAGSDITNLINSIVPTMTVKFADGNISSWQLDFATPFSDQPGTLIITPEFGATVDPKIQEDIDAALTKAKDKKTGYHSVTNALNFSLDGKFINDAKTYTYTARFDIDVFTVLRNLVLKTDLIGIIKANKGFPYAEKLFDGHNSKMFVEVKDGADAVLTAAMDPANLGTEDIVLSFNSTMLADTFFTDVFGVERPAGDGVKTVKVSPAALIADFNKNNFDYVAPKVPETAAPHIEVDKNGVVTWNAVEGAESYEVNVNGTITNQAKTARSITVKSGQNVKVTALDAQGKAIAKTAQTTYANADLVTKAVVKALNFVTAIDKVENDIVVPVALLKAGFIPALNAAADINTPAGKDLDTVFKALFADKSSLTIHAAQYPFFVTDNHTMNVAELMAGANKIYADKDAAGVKTLLEDKAVANVAGQAILTKGETTNLKADGEGKVAINAIAATDIAAFLKEATVNVGGKNLKVAKVIGLDLANKTDVQNVTLIVTNNFVDDATAAFIKAIAPKAYFPTEVVYTQIKLS